jgi:hypothetical protein
MDMDRHRRGSNLSKAMSEKVRTFITKQPMRCLPVATHNSEQTQMPTTTKCGAVERWDTIARTSAEAPKLGNSQMGKKRPAAGNFPRGSADIDR